MLISQLICLCVCPVIRPLFSGGNFQPTKQENFFFSLFLYFVCCFFNEIQLWKEKFKNAKHKKKNCKKILKKSYTILSYLTQHKTQRNLGGVIFCRHMYKCKNAYVKMSMFRWNVLVCMHQYKLRKKPLFAATGPFSPIGQRCGTTGTHSLAPSHFKAQRIVDYRP